MADKLAIYNDALDHLGERRLIAGEVREASRVLDGQWPLAVAWCLEMQPWSFATRTAAIQASGAVPPVAYASVLPKPADWLRTADLATDAAMSLPLTDFVDEGAFWFADPPAIWARYVSGGSAYGFNPALWPASFAEFVALRLAERAAARIKGLDSNPADTTIAGLAKAREAAMQAAMDAESAKMARVTPAAGAEGVRLAIYNAALAYLARPRIAARTDVRTDVRLLNDAWGEAVRWTLEQGPWTFAVRSIAIRPALKPVPTFGYRNAFAKPDDWLKTVAVARDDRFALPVTRYTDEGGLWYADEPGLFIRFVSIATTFGGDLAAWTASFRDVVAIRLAELVSPRIDPRLTGGLLAMRQDVMRRQRGNDALNTPPVKPPVGSWVRARTSGGGWGDRWCDDGAGSTALPGPTADLSLGSDTSLPINTDFIPRT